MNKRHASGIVRLLVAASLLFPPFARSQVTPVTTTADTVVPAYTGLFAYGSNLGYFGWNDNDNQVADILLGNPAQSQPGAGAHTLRGALYDDFIQTYGVNIRVSQFAHYESLGAIDNTIFVNASYHVAGTRRDPNHYDGCADQSWMHANMYLPIWIDDPTHPGFKKVNPQNYLADYMFQVVSTYKSYVKFYEVWNEPDFTPNYNASQNPASPQYWGTVNPAPCDLSNLKAPISHVNRLHRIVYEVVKTVDPSAYVATGGLGYPAFVQAMLRNTDNPGTSHQQNPGEGDGAEGSASARYPLRGGAYFDVLSYHSYPQYSLRRYGGSAAACTADELYIPSTGFCALANSDKAVAAYISLKQDFGNVLAAGGYDGASKPQKIFIVTENNVPRVMPRYANAGHTGLDPAGDQYGAEDYARNYVIKAMVASQKNGIRQYHLYSSSDEVQENGTDCAAAWVGTDNTKVQGLYKDLSCVTPYHQVPTVQYYAYKTTANLLFGYRYDAARTQALALPATADGAAFSDQADHVVYALWARATQHANENPTAVNYAFPANAASGILQRRSWDYSQTHITTATPASAVPLGGAPIFLAASFQPAVNDVIFRDGFGM
jgi:hypothetical protein